MKKTFFTLLLLATISVVAQEKEISSEVKSATVFLNSAQVTRSKKIPLTNGIQTLKFVNLSPFVDKKSIQVQAKGIEIQAINFKLNHLIKSKKSTEELALKKKFSELADKISLEEVNLYAIRQDIKFLNENRKIGGNNQKLTVSDLQQVSKFYSQQIKSLKGKELVVEKKISGLKKEKQNVIKQLTDLDSKKEFATGEIHIKVKSSASQIRDFQLTYNVSNVGWYPSYDIRVQDINSPLILVYKANLQQNSLVDWKNVKLRFSSVNPSQSTKTGKITPYFLNYGTLPPDYKAEIGEISGYVQDQDVPLAGVSVLVKGTTIGTTTDYNGRYSIKVPKAGETLVFSYLGFKTEERLAYQNSINVNLQEDNNVLDEVVVVSGGFDSNNLSYTTARKTAVASSVSSVSYDNKYSIPTEKIINQTSVSFEIVEPYTVKSSNKDFVISMKTYQSQVDYQYYAVPRIEESAFLVARLSDWEKFSLLEGEANVYFEDTFIGSTLIDTRYTEKELDISLGIDKNVVVNRTKSKDYTSRQLIGNKQEETSVWNFTVKNNKQQNIHMILLDQIPISTREEIRVTLDKLFKGELNTTTGEVEWNFELAPKKIKNITLKYTVRYPKNRRLVID